VSVFSGGLLGGLSGAVSMGWLVGPVPMVTDTGLLAISSIVTALSTLAGLVLVALIQAKSARDLAELKLRGDRDPRDEDEPDGSKEDA
jgi:predicted lipid-binding transport protein (Tim44 family)